VNYQTILCNVADNIATVTLERPQSRNAINRAMLDDLAQCVTRLAALEDVRAILLTASGDKAFAAGADLKELDAPTRQAGESLALHAQHVFSLIERCGKPVLACIQGYALGGGCELALACTLRLAADTAHLGQPEIKLGILPGWGGTQRLPRLIGRSAALKLILTGDPIPAAEALRLGLVDEVLPADQLLPRARELAAILAAQPPLAVAAILDTIHRGLDLPLDQALAIEAAAFGHLCATADKTEGIAAFLEKRKPTWTGK
jgi:enoyl-CoA hydratase